MERGPEAGRAKSAITAYTFATVIRLNYSKQKKSHFPKPRPASRDARRAWRGRMARLDRREPRALTRDVASGPGDLFTQNKKSKKSLFFFSMVSRTSKMPQISTKWYF